MPYLNPLKGIDMRIGSPHSERLRRPLKKLIDAHGKWDLNRILGCFTLKAKIVSYEISVDDKRIGQKQNRSGSSATGCRQKSLQCRLCGLQSTLDSSAF